MIVINNIRDFVLIYFLKHFQFYKIFVIWDQNLRFSYPESILSITISIINVQFIRQIIGVIGKVKYK